MNNDVPNYMWIVRYLFLSRETNQWTTFRLSIWWPWLKFKLHAELKTKKQSENKQTEVLWILEYSKKNYIILKFYR